MELCPAPEQTESCPQNILPTSGFLSIKHLLYSHPSQDSTQIAQSAAAGGSYIASIPHDAIKVYLCTLNLNWLVCTFKVLEPSGL